MICFAAFIYFPKNTVKVLMQNVGKKVLTNIHKKYIIVTQWKYNIKISRKEGDSVEIGCTVNQDH